MEQLELLGKCETETDIQYKRDLRAADSFIVDAYDQLGKATIEELKYSVTKIKAAMIIKRHREKASSTDVLELVNTYFHVGCWYSRKYIKSKLSKIYSDMEIPRIKAVTSGSIREFFEASESSRMEQKKKSNTKKQNKSDCKKQKGFLLLSRKFEC